MNRGLPGVSNPPSPLVNRGATNPDIPANDRFPSGVRVRQTATRTPHGSGDSGRIETHARRTDRRNETHRLRVWLAALALSLAFWLAFLGSLFAVHAFGKCRTHRCWHRVSVARHVRAAWRYYHQHPMPYCTWAYESGFGDPWKRSRYRVLNTSGSGAGGKFQIIYRTWLGYGGKPYGNARFAPPLEQERIARRILAGQGIHAWSRC